MPTKVCNRVLVERYFLNELKGEEKSTLRLHLDDCAKCRSQFTGLEIERRNYAMEHPFREFLARPGMSQRLEGLSMPGEKLEPLPGFSEKKKVRFPRWLPAVAGVGLCLIVLPLLQKGQEPNQGEAASDVSQGKQVVEADGIRTKGEPILEFYCKRDGAITPGHGSEAYRAGDELQFVYAGDGHSYVTLASIDGQGLVSLYRSEGESLKVSLEAKTGSRQTFPFSVTLDNSPGAELFVIVYSAKPLNGVLVDGWLKEAFTRASGNLESLARALAPPVSPKAAVKSVLLRKTRA